MRWRRALLVLFVALGVLTAGAVALSVRRGAASVADATVYFGIVTGLVGLIFGAMSLWGDKRTGAESVTATPGQVEAAADLLAERTLQSWSQQATARGIVIPAPVRVHWRWANPDLGATRDGLNRSPSLDIDPAPLVDQGAEVLGSGVVARLHDEVYARLRHGRLVLTGGPGTGKTGAMLLLMLAALRHRTGAPHEQRARAPVPVWLTLGSWNPDQQALRDWVIFSLRRDHPYLRAPDFGPDAPDRLFDTARIALFLDGLDELPDAHRPRAAQRLREESTGLRVVLTSRPDEYRALLQAGEKIPNTAVLEMRPVGVRASTKYLLDDRTPSDADRWAPLTTHLTTHPDGVLARTLSTPLTLSLARAAYQRTHTHPGELLQLDLDDPQSVRGHLLDQAVTSAYPDQKGRDHALYWLGWLAHHMNNRPAGPTRDLPWWHISTYPLRRQRLINQFVAALPFALALGLGGGLTLGLQAGLPGGLVVGAIAGLLITLVTGVVLGGVFELAGGSTVWAEPRVFAPRRPSRYEVAAILLKAPGFGLTFGLGLGLAFGLGLGFGLEIGLGLGMAGTLAGTLMGGFLFSTWDLLHIWGRPTSVAADMSPWRTHQAEKRYSVIAGITVGLTTMLAFGLFGLVFGLLVVPGGLRVALAGALVGGLVFGLVFGLGGSGADLSFAQVGLWLTMRRRVRFMHLLEEALERQILRQAGTAYQFRHAELQDRLAARYEQEHLDGPDQRTSRARSRVSGLAPVSPGAAKSRCHSETGKGGAGCVQN